MHPQYHEEVSKIMSKILRHKAVKYGIMGADDSAWLSVDDLARAGRLMGCEQDLIEVAKTSEKPKCAFKAMAASSAPRESTRASSSKPCMVEEIEHQKCTWQDHCKPHQLLRDVVHRSPAAATMAIFASHQLEECGRHCLPPARSICSSRQPAPRSRHFQWNRHPHHSRDSRNEKKRSPYEIHFPFPNEPSFLSGKILENKDFLR
jgi:hypothetical protein